MSDRPNRPPARRPKSDHANAARRTSKNRDSIVNMAEFRTLGSTGRGKSHVDDRRDQAGREIQAAQGQGGAQQESGPPGEFAGDPGTGCAEKPGAWYGSRSRFARRARRCSRSRRSRSLSLPLPPLPPPRRRNHSRPLRPRLPNLSRPRHPPLSPSWPSLSRPSPSQSNRQVPNRDQAGRPDFG